MASELVDGVRHAAAVLTDYLRATAQYGDLHMLEQWSMVVANERTTIGELARAHKESQGD